MKTIDYLKTSPVKDKDALRTILDGIPFSKDYVVRPQVTAQVGTVINREMGLLRTGEKPPRDVANTIATDTTALLPKG